MSPTEQRIYFALQNSGNHLFDTGLIRSYKLCSNGMLLPALASLVKKGWLTRIKRGLYTTDISTDPFKIGPYMFNGYLAFSSALYVYNAYDETPSVVYVANVNISAARHIGGIEVKGVAMHKRALGTTAYEGYAISTKAKTIYDCFYLPENVGGYGKILRAITLLKMNTADWTEFLSYVNRFEKDGFKRRIGYMLEMLNGIGNFVPRKVIGDLNVGGSTVKLGSGSGGRYIKKWNIVDYIGSDSLLGFGG